MKLAPLAHEACHAIELTPDGLERLTSASTWVDVYKLPEE